MNCLNRQVMIFIVIIMKTMYVNFSLVDQEIRYLLTSLSGQACWRWCATGGRQPVNRGGTRGGRVGLETGVERPLLSARAAPEYTTPFPAAGAGAARQGRGRGCWADVLSPLLLLVSSDQSFGLLSCSMAIFLFDDIRHLFSCDNPDLGGVPPDFAGVMGIVDLGQEMSQVCCYPA